MDFDLDPGLSDEMRAIRDTCQTPFYPETLLILVEPALRLFAMNIPVVGVGLLGAMMLSGGKNE